MSSADCLQTIRGFTPNNGLYGEAPSERETFLRVQVYKRVGVSQVEVYERLGKSALRENDK